MPSFAPQGDLGKVQFPASLQELKLSGGLLHIMQITGTPQPHLTPCVRPANTIEPHFAVRPQI